jgi:hypothetical protein
MRYDQDQAPTSHPHQHPNISVKRCPGRRWRQAVMKVFELAPDPSGPNNVPGTDHTRQAHGPRPPPPEGEEGQYW